jgi:hypothetical protein
MNKESAGVLQVVRRRTTTWLDKLTDLFRAMLDFMPRLRDAIDADDLPIPFLLRRGWERASRSGNERATPSPFKASNQFVASRSQRRPAARSTLRPTQSHPGDQTGSSHRSRHSTGDSVR